jgi:hypothetical protein
MMVVVLHCQKQARFFVFALVGAVAQIATINQHDIGTIN